MHRLRSPAPSTASALFFITALLLGVAQGQLAGGLADELAFAAPLGLLWVGPLIWGRRAVLPLLVGALASIAIAGGSTGLMFAGVLLTAADLSLGFWYSHNRTFTRGITGTRDLQALIGAAVVPALVRGIIVSTFAIRLGLPDPAALGLAAAALAWFASLTCAAMHSGLRNFGNLAKSTAAIAELAIILAALIALLHNLLAAPVATTPPLVRLPIVIGLIALETRLAVRYHIPGIGLYRLLALGLVAVHLALRGGIDHLLPLEAEPLACALAAIGLGMQLAAELAVGSTARELASGTASKAALAEELLARNIELEKLAAANLGQKAFLDSVLNQMPAGVMIVGTDGTILWRNRRHRDLWMDTTDGEGLRDLDRNRIAATKGHSVPFESWPIVKALTANVVTEGFEARILSPTREAIDVSIGAAPVHGPDGELLGAVSILHDTTERKAGVRLLRDKEERLRFALQSARMIACEWSISTRQFEAPEALANWLGLGAARLPALGSLLKVVHPNDLGLFQAAIAHFLDGGRECECEFRVPSERGMLWVQYRGRRTTDDDGRPADRIAGIMLDVTERRRSDERLRMLESAVVHARDAVVILESEPDRMPGRCVLYANDAFCEMTGYTAAELIGRSLHFLRGPDSDAATLERLRDSLDSGNPFKGELLNYRRDGERFWVELSVVPVPDDTGACAHWVMIQRDISRRKRAELDLQRSEAVLADAQRIAQIGSWEYFPSTGECRWSAETFRIYGHEPGAIVPTAERYLEALHVDDRGRVERAGRDRSPATYPHTLEFRIVRPDGEIRFVSEECYADFGTDGAPVRIWGVTLDSTEKKRAQEQLFQAQKMELIGQMAGGIAHDFNNLLTGIIGNLHLIRVTDERADRKHIQIALRAANRAADLTKKLLGFARKNQLVVTATGVRELVAEVVDFIGRTFDPRIRVAADIGADLRMDADSTLLAQVLLNLCLNARDAMPEGGRIEIRSAAVAASDCAALGRSDTVGDYIRLTVEDTGSGMAPEVLARVFEPFFTTKPVGQGTGLGLAMVHGILTQHRGWVEVHSEVGRGTRFDLYVPMSPGTPPMIKNPPAVESPLDRTPMPPARGQTILMVDDESMIRELGRAVLESGGYSVREAEDGEEALVAFRAGSAEIDLVLLDLTMPKLSGQDTFRAMAEIDPRVRVLFSSGYSSDDLAGTEGCLGLLPKPYHPQVLLDTVRRALATPRGSVLAIRETADAL